MPKEKIVKSFSTTIYRYGGPGPISDLSLEKQIQEYIKSENVEPISFSITSSVVDRSSTTDKFWKDFVCTAVGIFEKKEPVEE